MLNKPASGVLALRVGSTYLSYASLPCALRPCRTDVLSILSESTMATPEGHNR